MKKVGCWLITLLLLTACEKNIDFKLKDAENILVVDAEIENNQPPTVVLSKSTAFFSTINPSILSGTFVNNAVVTISNGTKTHQLKEYPINLGGGFTAFVYSNDVTNLATSFNGEFNKKYTLTITADGKTYTSETTIPLLTKFPDSVKYKNAPQNPDSNTRVLLAKVTDPVGLGNYIRYFTKKNSEPFLPGFNSVFDDRIVDGTTYEIQVDPGVDRNTTIKRDSLYFKKNDTVTLKLCNIDKNTYTFWNTWEFAQQSIGNPFAQPNKVVGNISNGALGAFCGYAAWYKKLIIK
jgi:Domain of unknown function (DUF4249)